VVAGTLNVAGDTKVNTDKFTVDAATGNTVVTGTLGVTGVATLTAVPVLPSGIVDDSTIQKVANVLSVKDGGITVAKMAAGAGWRHSGTQIFGSTGGALAPGTTFADLNLSAIVGANVALVMLKVQAVTNQNTFSFRTKGDSFDLSEGSALWQNYAGGASVAYCAPDKIAYVMVETDSSGFVQWATPYGSAGYLAKVWVAGYVK
jgi:hypothetical protein